MPTSEKQIAANRRNAQKSTGPRTPEGKKASSRNAIKHGLNVCDIILKPAQLSPSGAPLFKEDGSRIKVRDDRRDARSARNPFMGAETARINDQLETAAYDIERGDLILRLRSA